MHQIKSSVDLNKLRVGDTVTFLCGKCAECWEVYTVYDNQIVVNDVDYYPDGSVCRLRQSPYDIVHVSSKRKKAELSGKAG